MGARTSGRPLPPSSGGDESFYHRARLEINALRKGSVLIQLRRRADAGEGSLQLVILARLFLTDARRIPAPAYPGIRDSSRAPARKTRAGMTVYASGLGFG